MKPKTLRDETLPWGSFLRSIASIGIPVALANMLTTTGSMVDTMMIGKLGETFVGAVGLCAQFTSLMFSCYWGFVGGGILFYSQYYGAKDDEGVCRSYGITLTCMMTVAVLFFFLGRFFPSAVMRMYTDKTAIQEIGVDYLKIAAFAWPLQIFSVSASTVLRSTGQVRIPLISSVCSVGSNIFFNWIFIYGNLGAPRMGVRGAALATVFAAIVNTLVCLGLAAHVRFPYLFRFRDHFKWTKQYLKLYFQKCFPIICNELFMGISNACISMVMGRQDEHAIAAIAVFRTLEGLVISFFTGFANACAVLIGNSVGAGSLDLAFRQARRIVYCCSATIFCVCAVIFGFRVPILSSMGLSGLSLDYAQQFLLVYCLAATIRMGNWAQNDSFRAAGDPVFGTVMEITFMYLLVLPAVFVTGMVIHAPLMVVFLCCYIDEPIRYVIMQVHLYSGKWILPVTEQGKKALEEFMASRKKKT